jgi:indole-3-glycerol phosphate synthase
MNEILATTEEEVAKRAQALPISDLERRLQSRSARRPFAEALGGPGISVIAEFKRKAPSTGVLREDASARDYARLYEMGGAAALSVLTEKRRFGGSLNDLREARQATKLPVLQKDFVIDEYQVVEAAVAQADAILLIVAALEFEQLEYLYGRARMLDLDVLVEVHDHEELERALQLDTDVIGINNRDLTDFSVDVERTFELLTDVPTGKTVVSESGIKSRDELDELERVGVDAVLVGTTLMKADDPLVACQALTGRGVEAGE